MGWNLHEIVPAFSNLERFPFWMGFFVLFGLGWVAILVSTLLTRPEPIEKLREFYLTARPIGLWGPVRRSLTPEQAAATKQNLGTDLRACAWGIAFYFLLTVALFGFIGGRMTVGAVALLLAAGTGTMFARAAIRGARTEEDAAQIIAEGAVCNQPQ
jgi:hypothetical protein